MASTWGFLGGKIKHKPVMILSQSNMALHHTEVSPMQLKKVHSSLYACIYLGCDFSKIIWSKNLMTEFLRGTELGHEEIIRTVRRQHVYKLRGIIVNTDTQKNVAIEESMNGVISYFSAEKASPVMGVSTGNVKLGYHWSDTWTTDAVIAL